ncbi:MAG TPA: site-2 protease family protein [Verrucomicrobiae bacterium]|nr:site-2 protease family protein [Verrucomicrobiae bacterium]
MQENEVPPPLNGPATEPTTGQRLKKAFGPVAVVLIAIFNFFGKIKLLILPALKFLPVILKTGGTMILSIGAYAMFWGVWFAVGFVLLIFIHECGHLVAAKRLGLKVGAPVFIPFMGAIIALKEAPRNAWIESQVGIGGPILGAVGAGLCQLLYLATGNLMFRGLAYTGYFLNLFNLAPVGFLDGGRIVTALSPWLWLVGFVILVAMTLTHPNIILIIILIASVPRLFFLFRKKTEQELRYFEVTPAQRWIMAVLYFGLIVLLVQGMHATYIPHNTL